ncbi:signal peptidase I [Microgenomates group bacterium RIFCSPLOWO2_01_FULL_47_10]|nr:MAG: signal peptidase I [Microgenomates group bacterium RIFCSPLOWO2_01_FULL_47_10]
MTKPVIAIKLQHISKSFNLDKTTTLKEVFAPSSKSQHTFQALKDISFSITKNQTIGLFGANGSGKSTLLRLIAGMLKPDSGQIITHGKIAPVIELGSGLHPELTGSENIFLYGATLGMSQSQIRQAYAQIVTYSEIPAFMDQPIKKYSSGMKARLAFAIAIHSQPDILLLDEVLSVGDIDFRLKAIKSIQQLKTKSTVIVVSHDLNLLLNLCDKIVTLDQGKIVNQFDQESQQIKTFLSQILRDSQSIKIQATSNSMSPAIHSGDVLEIKKKSFLQIKIGQIIAFTFPNLCHFITHRIMAKTTLSGKVGYITKGDSNLSMDSWIITHANYLGTVTHINKTKYR